MSRGVKTKNLVVYEKLRQGIIKGTLKPGQKLIMASLAKTFGISETPVREAIRRLESDGYVTFTPHAGAMVSRIDNRNLSEIYLIRISLEALATRLAIPFIGKNDLVWLKKKNDEMKEAVKKDRYERLARLNKEFHLRIYKVAPYPRLYKMIADLWDSFERWPSIFSFVPERAASAIREHDEIIEALSTADPDRADKLMTTQKKNTMKAMQNYMVQLNTASPEIMTEILHKQAGQ
ncbi:MAG: GntR family transcriptional regulator [Desulfobacterales bacterium]|nr:GntR family transcriptional regulator [Desulfobacterales bacterium]